MLILLNNFVGDVQQRALAETTVRKDLIQQIDLGAFKYNVDYGLDIRKAAFSLLENILTEFYTNQEPVLNAVIEAIKHKDEDDQVRNQCLVFLCKIIVICPNVFLNQIEEVVKIL